MPLKITAGHVHGSFTRDATKPVPGSFTCLLSHYWFISLLIYLHPWFEPGHFSCSMNILFSLISQEKTIHHNIIPSSKLLPVKSLPLLATLHPLSILVPVKVITIVCASVHKARLDTSIETTNLPVIVFLKMQEILIQQKLKG